MLDLNSYFNNMSKPLLRKAHASAFGQKGLLNNALIQSEIFAFYSNKEHIESVTKKMEPWQIRCMALIYNSETRGLTYNELRLAAPINKSRELQAFLLNMCREFLLWRTSTSNGAVYYGFSNFIDCFKIEFKKVAVEKATCQSYQNLIIWHICKILAYAMSGELKLNNSNALHRRGYQECLDSLTFVKQISERAAEHELSLIFNFLVFNDWLERENSILTPSEKALEFLRKNGFRLHMDLLSWWISERFHGDNEHCANLLKLFKEPKSVDDATTLFWVLDPTFRLQEKSSIAWEYLPRPLCELWLLGFLHFNMIKDKVVSVSISKIGEEWVENHVIQQSEQNISCLPNFEIIASAGISPRVLFMLAGLAHINNDETYLRFTLDKESYMHGLKSCFSEDEIEHFKSWIKPPTNVASTLEEWNSSYYGARVQTVRLLKIDNADILNELSKFPKFVEYTNEFIPGYGFILKPECEVAAFDILSNYGYNPFVQSKCENREKAPAEEWRKDFSIAWPEKHSPDYELKDFSDSETLQTALNSTKYGSNYQKLSTFDLVKVLRYAKTVGALVGAKLKDPVKHGAKESEQNFFVQALKLAKSPQLIEILPYGKKQPEILELSFIQEVKVFNGKQP